MAEKVKPNVEARDQFRRRFGELRQFQNVKLDIVGQREPVRLLQQAKTRA
jgi:hypothetical protein